MKYNRTYSSILLVALMAFAGCAKEPAVQKQDKARTMRIFVPEMESAVAEGSRAVSDEEQLGLVVDYLPAPVAETRAPLGIGEMSRLDESAMENLRFRLWYSDFDTGEYENTVGYYTDISDVTHMGYYVEMKIPGYDMDLNKDGKIFDTGEVLVNYGDAGAAIFAQNENVAIPFESQSSITPNGKLCMKGYSYATGELEFNRFDVTRIQAKIDFALTIENVEGYYNLTDRIRNVSIQLKNVPKSYYGGMRSPMPTSGNNNDIIDASYYQDFEPIPAADFVVGQRYVWYTLPNNATTTSFNVSNSIQSATNVKQLTLANAAAGNLKFLPTHVSIKGQYDVTAGSNDWRDFELTIMPSLMSGGRYHVGIHDNTWYRIKVRLRGYLPSDDPRLELDWPIIQV
ncbi:hypothetical protein [uncultured Alistipes sp.]|uniref:hypothetical protein n=1 Tax=uncultured Alistipes sp. TaxID=538949 RepID=UPI0025D2580D|nr:hypothetical protein [uncultured Alistipes sp.]